MCTELPSAIHVAGATNVEPKKYWEGETGVKQMESTRSDDQNRREHPDNFLTTYIDPTNIAENGVSAHTAKSRFRQFWGSQKCEKSKSWKNEKCPKVISTSISVD